MKPLILPFVIALVASLGLGAGASVLQAKRAAPAHAVADSAKHAPAPHDSGLKVIDASGSADVAPVVPDSSGVTLAAHTPSAGATNGAAPVQQQGKPADAHAQPAPAAAPTPALVKSSPAAPAVAVPAGATAAGGPSEKRVARVFASMAPRDAAKVLEQMSDPDVSIILGNLAEKQAAAILAQLPAPRVAALSRVALRPTQGAK